jgi:uncharacterized protein
MKRRYAWLFTFFAVIAAVIFAISYGGDRLPEIPVPSDPRAQTGLNVIPVELPDGTQIAVEVARTPRQLARGLMFRDTVPALTGMLLVYNENGYRRIWMKNVRVNLDVVFIDENRKITHIVRHLQKEPENASYGEVPRAAGTGKYVLELAAGEADRLGLKKGMQLSFL